MKSIILPVSVLVLALSSTVSAQEPDQNHFQHATGEAGEHHQHAGMQEMDMNPHHEGMSRMRELMIQARNSDDPQERRRLMAEHHQMMQDRMNTMMSDGDHGSMMEHCRGHMTMMHDMMEQMMARQEMMDPGRSEAPDQ